MRAGTDTAIVACKQWFVTNAAALNSDLGTDGLPVRQGPAGVQLALQPADFFAQMAQAMPDEITRIAATLQAQDIWV